MPFASWPATNAASCSPIADRTAHRLPIYIPSRARCSSLRAMELAGSAMPPLAMILTGALIAKCELRRAISVRRVLPVLAMRFLITPGLVLLAIRGGLLPVSGLPAFILMLVAASPPAMNLALAAKRYDGDWSIISGVQLVASLVALAALPIWMSIGLLL